MRRTKEGEKITHDLRLVESMVVQEAQDEGPASRVFKAAVRLGTASELLWAYMSQIADKFTKGLKQYGWLARAEVTAWRELEALRRSAAAEDVETKRVLEAYTHDNDHPTD